MMDNINKAIALMNEAGFLGEQVRKAAELQDRLTENELIVSVIGQFKRGKSSLINAMLGSDILPVGIVPLTAVVTEIRHGNHFHAVVVFENGSQQSIKQAELPHFISEQENSENHKQVSLVSIRTPIELFGEGVLLVDTPGVGSVHKHNTETSLAFIEKSDAVLFLLSVDSPVSETEWDFLIHSRVHASKFYFAVNKIDTINAEGLDEFIEYSAAILSKAAGIPAKIYPVSAKTGEGIEALVENIAEEIRASHDEILSASVGYKMSGIIEQAKSKIGLYLKAAAVPTDELKEKLLAVREKQLVLSSLSEEFQLITQRKVQKLVHKIGESLDKRISELLPELHGKASQHHEELVKLPSRNYEKQLQSRIDGDLLEILTLLNEEGLIMLSDGYASIVASLNAKSVEAASFVSNMLMEFFSVQYLVNTREFPVSERNDYRIKLVRSGSFFITTDTLTHLLPRSKANARIYKRALAQIEGDIERNRNNMLYNYSYKMQESLRLLCREFAGDISEVNMELNVLFEHVEQSHQSASEALRLSTDTLSVLLLKLDEMKSAI
jgi:small GTP-binding protein